MNADTPNKMPRKLIISLVAAVVLLLGLCVTTYALATLSVAAKDNHFQTGNVELNLNDGKSVIDPDEFLFEPGMTVNKDFFVENRGSGSVYYRVYMQDVEGDLQNVLQITLKDGQKVLFSGTAAEFTAANTLAADGELAANAKHTLFISFHFPEERGNEAQSKTLSFKLCADAVQTENNPDKLFD